MSEARDPRQEPASGAPRRPTDDPRRYVIPAEQLPPGFAARLAAARGTPAAPRPAATVALVREAGGNPEVLLLRRPRRSAFAADAWVFPGGVVDDADREPDLLQGAAATAAEWARRLELDDPREATGYVVAALREVWEETGILLAAGAARDEERIDLARAELLRGVPLRELLVREGLRLEPDRLLYIAHWITPEAEPRRYDTRFFVARAPAGARCRLLGEELAEACWLPPAAAVERFREGSLSLLPPTAHTLQRLAAHGSLDTLWRTLRDAPVPSFLPRMRLDPEDDAVVIEIIEER